MPEALLTRLPKGEDLLVALTTRFPGTRHEKGGLYRDWSAGPLRAGIL